MTGKQEAMSKVMDVTMNGGGQQRQSFGAQHKGLPVDSGQPGPDTQLLLAATAGDVAKAMTAHMFYSEPAEGQECTWSP